MMPSSQYDAPACYTCTKGKYGCNRGQPCARCVDRQLNSTCNYYYGKNTPKPASLAEQSHPTMSQSVGDNLTQATQAQSDTPFLATAMSQVAGENEGRAQSSHSDSTLQPAAVSQAHEGNDSQADDTPFGSPLPEAPEYQGAGETQDEIQFQPSSGASKSTGSSQTGEEEKPTKTAAEIAAEVAAVEQAKKEAEGKFMNEICFWEDDYHTPKGLPEKHVQYHNEWLANEKAKEETKAARK